MSLQTRFGAIVLSCVLAASADASAQITDGPLLSISPGRVFRNNAAYSTVHGVYLVIVDRPPGAPLTGRFLDKNGSPIGPDFRISFEAGDPYIGWVSLAFGGPPSDPVFLVTYLVAEGANPKIGRFIRYAPGAPTVSGPIKIADVGSEWFAAEKAQQFWNGLHWVVGTRVLPAGWTVPTPMVNALAMNGSVSAPVILGDGLDFYGSPALTCAGGGVCLAIGFMAGIPTGYSGGTYARRFDGPTLTPLGNLFFLSSGSPNEDQGVVYQAHAGRFLAQWFRGGGPGYIDTRLIGLDGSLSPLDLNRGIGPNAGTNAIAYNAGTRTSLLMTKWTDAALIVLELGDDGYPRDMNNLVLVTNWDGATPDYWPSIAANDTDRQWLVTATLAAGTMGKIIRLSQEVQDPTNLVQNGSFTTGLTGWTLFAEPNPGDLVASVVGGVLSFYRLPSSGPGQAGVRQSVGVGMAANATLSATFDLGNSSNVRKRITVFLHDANFSDAYNCTFWLSAGAPMRSYRMNTHANRAWTNTTISLYAGSTGAEGGTYRLDNVRVFTTSGQPSDRTECVDPTTPSPGSQADGPTMLTNGSFSSGLPPWSVFGQITHRISGGVFEFIRPAGTPAGVVLQATGVALPLHARLTLTLGLGNSSNVRKRVTVVAHDSDFSDLADCTFWLEPGQAIGAHTIKLFATKAWANATVAVYGADVDTAQWTRLDDVSLRVTPTAALLGTECVEASGPSPVPPPTGPTNPGPGRRRPGDSVGQAVPRPPFGAIVGGGANRRSLWPAAITGNGGLDVRGASPIDLSGAGGALLWFESDLPGGRTDASIEVTRDGAQWIRVAAVPSSEGCALTAVDLSEYAGEVIYVRFVSGAGVEPGWPWAIRNVQIEIRHQQTPRFPLPRRR